MEVDKAGCIYNYVVTAQRPTAVLFSAVGHFTSSTDINLIVAKSTRLEVFKLGIDGLALLHDVPIFGRIAFMSLLQRKGSSKEQLFVLTEHYKCMVLDYDTTSGSFITRGSGDMRDTVGRPVDSGISGAVDLDMRCIALHLYEGIIKIVPIESGGELGRAVNMRLEELEVVDFTFLAACSKPTLALIYQDRNHERHLKTYEVKGREELVEGPWGVQPLDAGAGFIIPVPAPVGGAIVVGGSCVMYVAGKVQPSRSVPVQQMLVSKAYARIDPHGSRYLLGDNVGGLHLLVLAMEGGRVASLKLQCLGRATFPSALSYIDAGLVHVGGRGGDSLLLRLHPEPVAPEDPTNYIEVVNTYPNLGPIVDFVVMDLDRQGQGQVVTASGLCPDASLRIVRSGIGITERAAVEMPGIKGLWGLRQHSDDLAHKYLLLTFVGATRLLGMNSDDELEEVDVAPEGSERVGIDPQAQTLWCGSSAAGQLVQVTFNSVRLVDSTSLVLVDSWSPPAGETVTMAAGTPNYVLLATSTRRVVLLDLRPTSLHDLHSITVDSDISCLDISTPDFSDAGFPPLAVVGTWDKDVLLLHLPDLSLVIKEQLGGEVIPRSTLLALLEGVRYLLVGMGDGALLTWRLDGDSLAQPGAVPDHPMDGSSGVGSGPGSAAAVSMVDSRRVALGTKPIMLRAFVSGGVTYAFAASDRPTVVYSGNKKLLYANLNENEVNYISSFSTSAFPDSLAMAKEEGLVVGSVDSIQKLHVRKVPLNELPRRLAHQAATKTLGLASMGTKSAFALDGPSFFHVLDDSTFDTLATHQLQPLEVPEALASTSLGEDPTPYYVLGTAFIRPDEAEPSKGRILVFAYRGAGVLELVREKEVKGAVWQVLGLQGKLLASYNSRVAIFRWQAANESTPQLERECEHIGHVMSLYLAARGDCILVGDLMKSLTLLMYKGEKTLEARARDFHSQWTTAVEILDDDTYVAAENTSNLFVVRKNSDAANDEERSRLEMVGEYHLGEMVNRFRRGSLVMRLPDSEVSGLPTLLYGTIDGSLGLLVSVPQPLYAWLSRLQDSMRKVVPSIGSLDHATWRQFDTPWRTSPSQNFIDGDLIEAFLELPVPDATAVAQAMGEATADQVRKRVEELSRLH